MTTPQRPTRILIADDQENVRSGFRLILDSQPDMVVVGEAADGVAALEQVRLLRPDVVLADIRMPKLDGLELTRRIAAPAADSSGAHAPKVVVVTTFDLDEYVHTALANGACGFLLKRSGPTLLVEAVRAAMAGDTLISPQLTVRLLRHVAERPNSNPASASGPAGGRGSGAGAGLGSALGSGAGAALGPGAAGLGSGAGAGSAARPVEPLTDRELEVVRLVAAGMTNAEIGAELFVSAGTVKTHIANVGRKLDVRNRVEIAAWAWQSGLATTRS